MAKRYNKNEKTLNSSRPQELYKAGSAYGTVSPEDLQ